MHLVKLKFITVNEYNLRDITIHLTDSSKGIAMRTFVSVDLEDPMVLSRVKRVKDSLESLDVDLKPVEDENLHITLIFIGEISDIQAELVKEALGEVSFPTFTAHLKGVGCFPSCNRPRVIWIGVREGAEKLIELYRRVAGALRRTKVQFEEERDYTPHLTIARVRSGRNVWRLSEAIVGLEDEDFGWIRVAEFRLKKSTLTPRGPIYETISSYKLL